MSPLLLALDDGLTNGNFNAADIFFLIAVGLGILAGLAFVISGYPVVEGSQDRYGRYRPFSRWGGALAAFAVAALAFGWFLL